ncbi:hypothetical protein C8J30_101660 [Rhodobacter viridis]|uniref:Uncharacterized protein n=1 Tax=Rhodobacter viridis TaxID=1054202 RepID=A0A318UBF7_9RHOB|nr:helix-turn-helix domain-containing protein [Rhodobacter viridis]PYF13271.1 hypothetical protein C8J30_101660 [Rhodobacter viridis]
MNELQRPSPPPPANIAPYVEVLGVDLAIEFFLAFGGAYVTFPTTSDRRPIDGAAAQLGGVERLIALGDALAVAHTRIPLANKWLAKVLAWKGFAVAQIARRIRVADVTVVRWLDDRVNPWPSGWIGNGKDAQ